MNVTASHAEVNTRDRRPSQDDRRWWAAQQQTYDAPEPAPWEVEIELEHQLRQQLRLGARELRDEHEPCGTLGGHPADEHELFAADPEAEHYLDRWAARIALDEGW